MVGRLLVGFVWLNLLSSMSWWVDFQWASCVSIFSFLCHGWQSFSGVRLAQFLVFCVMVGRHLVGFVWLNLQFSVSWQVDFQWTSCVSIFTFLCHGWQSFSGVRVAQFLVFCVMVGRHLVGFVWLNFQFSVSWLVHIQWGSCGSIFSFLCHDWQTFSRICVAQSLVFYVMVGRLLVGFVYLNLQFSVSWMVVFQWDSCGSIFSFLRHGRQTFSGVLVTQSLVFCVMVDRLLVGFVWLNLQFSVSCQVVFQWGSCDSIFSFPCHGWQTFSGVCEAQSLVFCVMVGRLLVEFVWLNLYFSVSRQVDFQWGSLGSIFSFLCHGWQTFSGVRVAQLLVFCVMVGRLLVGFVWLNLVFCVMVGRLLLGFVWLNLQVSVSWQVDFQRVSCGSIFSFLCHGRQTFSGVRVAQSFVFCVMVDRLLVGFVWFNLQFSASWQIDFQGGSCGSIFRFLCHGRQTFSGSRMAQSLVFCVMVGRLLVGFVWLSLLFSASWQIDFQWGSCGSIFSFLRHGRQTFRGVRVAQSLVFCVMVGRFLVGFVWLNLVFCVMVGRLLVGFVWLNLQFSVSWQVDFQWGSCGSIFSFLGHGRQTFSGVRVAQSLVLCHGRQTFRGVRVAQSLVFCVMVGRYLVGFVRLYLQFCVMVGRLLVGYVWLNLQFCVMVGRLLVGFVLLNLWFSLSWQQTFSGVRVAQSLVFCAMVGRRLVGFVWFNLQFSVS